MKKLACLLLLVLLVGGCATIPPTQEEISKLNLQSQPPLTTDYKQDIKNYFSDILFDPYSAVYEFDQPQIGWYKEAFNGKLYGGWIVKVKVNAKNRMGGYVGKQPYAFIFERNAIVKVIPPEEIEFSRGLN